MDSISILSNISKLRNILKRSLTRFSLNTSKKIMFSTFLLMNIVYTLVQNNDRVAGVYKIFIFTLLFLFTATFSLSSDLRITVSTYREKSLMPVFIFFLLGIGTGITAIVERSITYALLSIIFLIIVPLTYSILNINNICFLIEQYMKAYVFYLALLFVLSMLFIPLHKAQYGAIFQDPNELAYNSTLGIVFICFHLSSDRDSFFSKKHIFYMIMLGATITFICISTSRTGMFLTVIILLYELMQSIYAQRSTGNLKHLMIKVIFIISISVIIFLWLSYLTPLLLSCLSFLKNSAFKNQLSGFIKELNSLKGNQLEYMEGFKEKISRGISNNSSFLSGRFEIWRIFIKKVSFFGHKKEIVYEPVHFGEKMFAHNTLLQIWYSLGFIAMIGHLFNVLFILSKCLIFMTKISKLDRFKVLYLEIAFVTIGFLSLYSIYNPFYFPIPFNLMLITFASKRYPKNRYSKIPDRIYHTIPSLEK